MQTMVTHIQIRVQSNEDGVLLVNAQRDIHKCLIVQCVCLSISNKECALEVLHPDSCSNIVRGLAPTVWEKCVVCNAPPGVGSIAATHNNYLVVTAFVNQGREKLLFLMDNNNLTIQVSYTALQMVCTPSPTADS